MAQRQPTAQERAQVLNLQTNLQKACGKTPDKANEGAFYPEKVSISERGRSILELWGRVVINNELLDALVFFGNPSFWAIPTNGAVKFEKLQKTSRAKENDFAGAWQNMLADLTTQGFFVFNTVKKSVTIAREGGELLTQQEYNKQISANAGTGSKAKSAVTRLDKLSEAVHSFLAYCNIATHEAYKTRWEVFAKELRKEAERKDAEQTAANAVTREQNNLAKSVKNLLDANIDKNELLELLTKMLKN